MTTVRQEQGGAVGPIARSVARDVAARAAGCRFDPQDDPRGAERELGRFAFRWAFATLQKMGVLRQPGEVYAPGELERRLGIVPKYHRHFAALIHRLDDEGLVRVSDRGVEATDRILEAPFGPVEGQVAAFEKSFLDRYPSCAGLFRFMACCLGRYEEIATGAVDAADVVFQDGNMGIFGDVFGGDVVSDYFNRLVAEAVRGVVAATPSRRVRVVEVGAGTGGTTAAVLAALAPLAERVEFVFTDISAAFLRYGRRRFSAQYPWADYKILNIEEDPAAQGFDPFSFDVLVAANVLHDTRDIERTLEQARRLLAPGGLLVLNEYTAVKDCLFFSGALLHGYWLFEDPERRIRDSCLLTVPQWSRVLERTGFAVAGAFALPTQNADAECGQSVILCEAVGAAGAEAEARPEAGAIVGQHIEEDILTLLGDERSSAYSARRPLMEMGLDSIELVELKSLMRGRFGVKLPPAFLFEHPTQEKIAQALAPLISEERLRELAPRETAVVRPLPEPVPEPVREVREKAVEDDPLAIVGIACRFPGGAATPEAFWDLLDRGGDAIRTLPAGRWRWPAAIDPQGRHRGIDRGGFLESIDGFDARFFRTSPREADLMDPQQRLLLELSWEALEDAGERPSALAGRKVGVFVGVCQSDYRDVLVAAEAAAEGYVGSGTAYAMLANRLSYFYDFKGPSVTVDTACSSSLFALHDARNALRRGDCEVALVGAVNLLCSPTISVSYYQAGMLSPTGSCKTFDASADGYVRGEGGAVLVVKPLSRAVADGDAVYGLVRGTAVNHGGQATTLTAPRPDAQAEVIETAWRQAGAAPGAAGYVEAHGTGTKLGDPIEISGLTAAFHRLGMMESRCGLGSVKSNVGHLEAAAGLAGVIKILLSLQHGRIPATLHFERLNPEIELSGSPFHIVARSEPWPRLRDREGRELARRAGISSFGFGGANAHAVIEEAPRCAERAAASESPCIVPLSARSEDELIARARGLLAFLERLELERPDDGAAPSSSESCVASLGDLLRQRFDSGIEPTADLEWAELGWDAVETRLFLSGVEETHGVRLPSRALLDSPSLGALAERIARERGGAVEPRPKPGSGSAASSLVDIAWTLQTGREPMAERVAFVVATRQELAAELRSFVAGASGASGTPRRHRGFARAGQGTARAGAGLPELASLWVGGAEVDWERLAASPRPRRVHLPAYPFARARHWVTAGPAPAGAPTMHPLLNRRQSLPEYRFETVLTGEEPFLADHVIAGRPMLPGVAWLEMARAAVERMAGAAQAGGGTAVWLERVTWLRPLAVTGEPVRATLRLIPEDGGVLDFELLSDEAGEAVFHGQGRAGIGIAAEPPPVDVAALRARCTSARFTADDLYPAFAAMGYRYGPALQGLEELFVGTDEILARLRLPAFLAATREEMVLHPSLADAAVQAIFGFVLAERNGAPGGAPALPFELERAEILRPCPPALWAAVRRDGSTCDIDLCDDAGRLCARFRGLILRAAAPRPAAGPLVGELLLRPLWDAVTAEAGELGAGPVAIAGGTPEQRAALREVHPDAVLLESGGETAVPDAVRHLVWIVPPHQPASAADDSILAAQEDGVLSGFRRIKALLAGGAGDRPLTWTVITAGTAAVHPGEVASPTHAGVHGLIGTMAREYPGWPVRLLDLPAAGPWPAWRDILAFPPDPHGNPAAWRDGRWYRPRLLPSPPAGEPAAAIRPDGVYVVIGGAGGIGEAWSEALLRRGPARLVWVGRRPLDASIQARLDRLAALGPAPLYLAADATDREQLAGVRAAVLEAYGRIDGLVHAAVVLRDHSLENMTEEEMRTGLAPKIDVSVRLAQVFGGDALDFVLVFSSMMSFVKEPGQANYVAGCAFTDAFARRLAAEWPCRVRVINWGYWASVGVASSERLRERMARKGFGSIELPGAMAALDYLLGGPAGQLAYIVTTNAAALEGTGAVPGDPLVPAAPAARPQRLLATPSLPAALSSLPAETPPDRSAAGIAEVMRQPREAATDRLLTLLRFVAAETLGVDPASLDSRSRPFADALLGEFGMDSLSSNSLRNVLRRDLGVDLAVHRIISEKVRVLAGELYGQLLLRHVSQDAPAAGEETEIFVF
jgi:polyketide synthase PksM